MTRRLAGDRKPFVSERYLQSSTTTGSSSNPSHSSYPTSGTSGALTGSSYTTGSTYELRTTSTVPTLVEQRHQVRPMGKHKLFCVFGSYEIKNYSYVFIDGLCDYAFITFFARDDDSFHLLQRTCHSEITGCVHVCKDHVLRNSRGPKLIRGHQEKLKGDYPPVPPSPRGFLVLGIRLWPANMEPFLAAIDKAFKRWFNVDGVIPLTHINVDEFIAGYPQCWISGGAPYRLAPKSKNSNVLGMVKTMEAINFTAWYGYPSLAVSVSMCTRVYKAQAAYCNSLNPYGNPTVDATQNVVVGTSKSVTAKDALSTFESQFTMNSKYCDINKMFGRLDLGLALFDLECEDWTLECPAPTAGISGTRRFRNVSNHTHKLASMGVANACP
ncbi:hypothetical protein MTO96_009434 [Rhipicephalus appendiculatus]